MTTIVLADDHEVVRQGMRTLLQIEQDLQVIGDASDGLEAIAVVEKMKPEILVVDIMMPSLNGLEVTRQVCERMPGTKVIVLSARTSEPYVIEALSNGASAYVLKTSSGKELVHAVREVLAGRRYLSPPLSERAIEAYLQKSKESEGGDLYRTLTTREREILQLAAEGVNNSEIANRLSISPYTAMTHRTNLMRKLGLHTQADLTRYAIQRGLISLDE